MRKNTKSRAGWIAWGLIGLFLLYFAGKTLFTQIQLNEYKKDFAQVDHPQGTSLVDSIAIKFSYYPATYADDSIKSQCAYLFGELRTHTQGWNKLEAFYSGSTLDVNGNNLHVGIIPVGLYGRDNSLFQVGEVDEYLYGQFEIELLGELQSHYSLWGTPKNMNASYNYYLVYVSSKVPCR